MRRSIFVMGVSILVLGLGALTGCDSDGATIAGAFAAGAADAANAHYGHPTDFGQQYINAVTQNSDSAATESPEATSNPLSTDDSATEGR